MQVPIQRTGGRQTSHPRREGISLDREVGRSPLPLLARLWFHKTTIVESADFVPQLSGEEDVEDILGINSFYHHRKPNISFLNQENLKA